MSEAEDLVARIDALAAPLAADLGVDLLDVEVRGQRGRRVLRLTADADGGVDVDTIATLSRRIGHALDETDLIDGAYTLEVSSPGADRPLRQPRDFRRNVGRAVRVTRTEEAATAGRGELVGTVTEVGDDAVTLDVDGDTVVLPLADVDHGKVVLPW